MLPYLIDLGEVTLPLLGPVRLALPTYGLLVATALVVAWLLFFRLARADGLPAEATARVAFWSIVAGLLGGKAGLVLVDIDWYAAHPGELLSLRLLTAAGVVWTALLAGLATLTILARRAGLPAGRVLDAAALTVPVAQGIGRLGCLMAGCCYGAACELPWAITYHSHEARLRTGVPLGTPLHPTPVYEALASLVVVLPALLFVRRARRAAGEVTLAYLVTYGTARFVIEFSRGDAARGLWFGGAFSTSQLLSLAVVPLALLGWLALRRRAAAGRPGAPGAGSAAGP